MSSERRCNGGCQYHSHRADGNESNLDLAARKKADERAADADAQGDHADDVAGARFGPRRQLRLAVHVHGRAHERDEEGEKGDADHREDQRPRLEQQPNVLDKRLEDVGWEGAIRVGGGHALDEQAGHRADDGQRGEDDADEVLLATEVVGHDAAGDGAEDDSEKGK